MKQDNKNQIIDELKSIVNLVDNKKHPNGVILTNEEVLDEIWIKIIDVIFHIKEFL